jgi:hypothetical protein
VRRSFEALVSAYEQFLVFIVFECVVVFIFALVGNVLIEVPEGTATDSFTNNYSSLGHMIFIMYVTGSYDAFPDNQLLAFSISQWFEIFFLLFVFLNMFLFSSIPGSLLFDCFIETRSKYILLDEIKMQHSLILAFISLGDRNYEIDIQVIIHFLNHLFAHQTAAVDAVTELCLKMNDDGNCSVVTPPLPSTSSSSSASDASSRKTPTSSPPPSQSSPSTTPSNSASPPSSPPVPPSSTPASPTSSPCSPCSGPASDWAASSRATSGC